MSGVGGEGGRFAFLFPQSVNYFYVHLDVWASVSLFKGVNIAPRNKQ